uniref:Uncharacterized protein n=1 Tax=Ornithodoros erraticus TaxID=265619 RepID=A0A293MGQ1_ORNER
MKPSMFIMTAMTLASSSWTSIVIMNLMTHSLYTFQFYMFSKTCFPREAYIYAHYLLALIVHVMSST